MAQKIVETPLMKQYMEMKKKHPDALLLFRVGDFYETFSQDAIDSSAILGITLTRRANGAAQTVELAGFPHHALDTYLPKLVRAGRRVAICEQLEDPKLAKKLVKRGITELITPGVNTNDASLQKGENNFLGAVHFGKNRIGAAFLDITTGEFLCAHGSKEYIDKLFCNIRPKETLRMSGTRALYDEVFHHRSAVYDQEDWKYTPMAANERLLKHFGTNSLKGFGVEDMPEAVIAAGSILYYLDFTQHTNIGHITRLSRIEEERYVRLDRFTVRNLELLEPMVPDGKALVDVIDATCTPMGARLLRRWLLFPILDVQELNRRHDTVDYFFQDTDLRSRLHSVLEIMGDVERLAGKLAGQRIGPRDFLQLKEAVRGMEVCRQMFCEASLEAVRKKGEGMASLGKVVEIVGATLDPNAPAMLSKGNAVAPGVNEELDQLRYTVTHSKEALAQIQQREAEATGIPSLKIGFNNVFGYYIEVRNTHRDKVPEGWIRKQTLVSAERYITQELKEYEETILHADEKIAFLENEIYRRLMEQVIPYCGDILRNAAVIAEMDCLLSFAVTAADNRYVRPVVDDSTEIEIVEGRHPVIEKQLPPGESYVANSVRLDCDKQQVIMLTGPNMSGKSAFLRQTALIALMAQIGSFVPAESARIGYVDKIFTRVGASDNLSVGDSTFMVEMNEAAAILNNMSNRSLILFDELGRGTSTYDGISIAWSIVEHIHENGRVRPRTLFATHYHELNEMEKSFSRIANYNVSVEEIGDRIVFMRKIKRGGSEHSFGIHVAKLAGMPPSIVERAGKVLRQLEEAAPKEGEINAKGGLDHLGKNRDGYQLSFFQLDDPLLSQIRDKIITLDIDNLTPLQALTTLHDLKGLITGKSRG